MIVWALLSWFLAAAAAVFLRLRLRGRPARYAIVALTSIFLAVYSWRVAFPQRAVDFDTWAEVSRWRLGRIQELFKPHRPLQYYLEYWIVRGLVFSTGADERAARAAIVTASLVAAFLVLVNMRRTVFRSSSVALPVFWAVGFALSPGGEFLVDTWNDHMPLVPLYLLGLALLLRLQAEPRRTALGAGAVFIAASALHTAEVWLWACGVAAFVGVCTDKNCPRSGLHDTKNIRYRVHPALVLLGFMLLVTAAIVLGYPGAGGASAVRYLDIYRGRNWGAETLRVFAAGFEQGGAGVVRARVLWPIIGAVIALLAMAAWATGGAGRRLRDRTLLVLCAAAVAFPLLYETSNPERYYTLAVLVPLVSAIHLRRCGFALRRKRLLSGVAAGFLGLLAVAGAVSQAPETAATLGEEHVYNRYGALLRERLDPRGVLIVQPEGSFYLWMHFWYGGKVRVVEEGESAAQVVMQTMAKSRRPVYLNGRAVQSLPGTDREKLQRVFERPGDPATVIYRLDG
ncbi:MAG: hypothetical protein N2111_11445 [Candidatus Sumerlaeaceae bacterium]|nr:hypothetical protein [Candidatus Sumerlaeaceae bacterium]